MTSNNRDYLDRRREWTSNEFNAWRERVHSRRFGSNNFLNLASSIIYAGLATALIGALFDSSEQRVGLVALGAVTIAGTAHTTRHELASRITALEDEVYELFQRQFDAREQTQSRQQGKDDQIPVD